MVCCGRRCWGDLRTRYHWRMWDEDVFHHDSPVTIRTMKKRPLTILIRLFLLFFIILAACTTVFPSLGSKAEWVTVAIIPYLFLGVLVVLALIGLRPSARRRRLANYRAKQGLCIGCGYDLRGQGSGQRCSECGATFQHVPI